MVLSNGQNLPIAEERGAAFREGADYDSVNSMIDSRLCPIFGVYSTSAMSTIFA